MLQYRKQAFASIKIMLEALRENAKDLQLLLAFQRTLFEEIIRAESHIARLKDELSANVKTRKTGRNDKTVAEHLKRRERALRSRLDKYRDLVYVWRSFGDALLFSYADRFALKHTYYATSDYNPKQDAGFLSGKDGRQQEILLLEAAIAAGVPAVLCDLTNNARYGDVCLLGGPDPYFLEVKSRRSLNERGIRQLADIEKLHKFYETDIAQQFRGTPLVRRVAHCGGEVSYAAALNECLSQTTATTSFVVCPEPGLSYASTYVNKEEGILVFLAHTLEKTKCDNPMIFRWNAIKDNKLWSPFEPFTRIIRNPSYLYDFINNRLSIFVILDLTELCRSSEWNRLTPSLSDKKHYPILLSHKDFSGYGGYVSEHLLYRMGVECLSLAWIVKSQSEIMQKAISDEVNAVF